jgi:hypothetical protein
VSDRTVLAQWAGRLAILFVSVAVLTVLALPGVHEAFDYLIAGTFASALTLVVAFGLFMTGRL